MKNLYEILGLSNNASPQDIRKAYTRLAMENHPDKGGSEEKFKEISSAYDILKDPDKKKNYDLYGTIDENNASQSNFSFFNMNVNNNNIIIQINVTLEQLYNGDKIKKIVPVKRICKVCGGCGVKNNDKKYKCKECYGRGIKIVMRQIAPGFVQQMQTICNKCNGEGIIINEKNRCKKCIGKKIIMIEKKIDIVINSSICDNGEIRYVGKGNEQPGFQRGDIIFVITEEEHKNYKRFDKYNLFTKKTINLVEALMGSNIIFQHLDGRYICAELNTIIKPGSLKKIIGEGIPRGKGDLIVEFDVEFPQSVKKDYKTLLEKVLKQKIISPNLDKCEKKSLTDCEMKKIYDEDDNNETVECHQQ